MDYRIINARTDIDACMGVYGHRKRVCTESWLQENNPCRTGESNLPQRRAGPTLYQLSYTPSGTSLQRLDDGISKPTPHLAQVYKDLTMGFQNLHPIWHKFTKTWRWNFKTYTPSGTSLQNLTMEFQNRHTVFQKSLAIMSPSLVC